MKADRGINDAGKFAREIDHLAIGFGSDAGDEHRGDACVQRALDCARGVGILVSVEMKVSVDHTIPQSYNSRRSVRMALAVPMSELSLMWRNTRMVVLCAISAALYAAVLVPFKVVPLIPGVTELRPANAIPIVCSFLFGPAAAWGSAIGNMIGDFFGGGWPPAH